MSQSKYHTVTVKSKDPSLPPTGANTQVLLDGQPLKACTFLKVEFNARKVTKIVLEIIAHAEIQTMGELHQKVAKVLVK